MPLRTRFHHTILRATVVMFAITAGAQSPPSPEQPPSERPTTGGIYRTPFLPSAVGPTCESARLVSPDKHCVAYYHQTLGSGENAQARAHLDCKWQGRELQDEIV